jgi:hypothetical protein
MRPAHITPLLHYFHTISKGQNIIIIIIIIIMLSAPVSIQQSRNLFNRRPGFLFPSD